MQLAVKKPSFKQARLNYLQKLENNYSLNLLGLLLALVYSSRPTRNYWLLSQDTSQKGHG